jgi:hypothetical protein
MTMVASNFIAALQITDIRYDLGSYGTFFNDIPSRLGTSDALDAAVNAFTVTFSSIYSYRRPVEVMSSYGRALEALRMSLYDPIESRSANTICAVYLVTLCQVSSEKSMRDMLALTSLKGWIGRRDDHYPHHMRALAYLVNARASQDWEDSFERDLMITLTRAVVCNPES